MAAKFRSARSNHTVTVGRIQARIVRSADKERAQNQGPVRSVVRGSSPAVGLTGRVPSVVRQKEREREREREFRAESIRRFAIDSRTAADRVLNGSEIQILDGTIAVTLTHNTLMQTTVPWIRLLLSPSRTHSRSRCKPEGFLCRT